MKCQNDVKIKRMQFVLSCPEDFVCFLFLCCLHKCHKRWNVRGSKMFENVMTMFYCRNCCIGDSPLLLNYCQRSWGSWFQVCEFCLKLDVAHTYFFKVLVVYTKGTTTLKSWTRSTVEPLSNVLPHLAFSFSDPETVIWMVNFLHLGFSSSSLPIPTALKRSLLCSVIFNIIFIWQRII